MLIKSGTITQGSGSIGGMTMSHNRGGLYLRARTVPTDPNTTRQQAARSSFTNVVQQWTTGLDDGQRASWSMWAANTPFTNALGDPLVLTGQQAFVYSQQLNRQVAMSGLSGAAGPVLDAPTMYNTGEAVTGVDDPTFGTDTLTVDVHLAAPASSNGQLILFVGRPQNSSKAFFKGPYQLAAIVALISGDDHEQFVIDTTDPTSWVASFVPAVGDHLPVKVVAMYNDGRLSQQFRDFVDVIAAGP